MRLERSWTPEQREYVYANTNLSPMPYQVYLGGLSKERRRNVGMSLWARKRYYDRIGRPDLWQEHLRYFFLGTYPRLPLPGNPAAKEAVGAK